ncbi:MAG: homoserine dehydrogenase [Phycisphaerales bacterium]|nr:homoserine dehydrogenase [Phycisphaerales bacterium]
MRIALVGFGVVGKSLVELLDAQREMLLTRHGLNPKIVAVADTKGIAISEHGLSAAELLACKNAHATVGAMPAHGQLGASPDRAIREAGCDVLIETSPSDLRRPEVAIGHLRAAMSAGMHVVTVNKAPLAVAMPALLELARYNRVGFRFSGTVGAGTPVLALASRCAQGNHIRGLRAIINGTTNFILSRMTETGERFDDALAEAVRLGYAETDPSNDIDAVDTAMKLTILANHVMGRRATIADVRREGIRGIARERLEDARSRNCVIKLIGRIDDSGMSVAPEEVAIGSPLNVGGSLNAVALDCTVGGEVVIVGRGAGGPETATAILRDLIDVWQIDFDHQHRRVQP